MKREQIERLQKEITNLKASWPAHSGKPFMMQKLEELEETLDKVMNEEKDSA